MNKQNSIIPMAKGEYGYKSTAHFVTRICPQCKQEYRRYPGEVEYIFDGKKFCHFPCKNQYRKAHPELDLTDAERAELVVEKYKKMSKNQKNKKGH